MEAEVAIARNGNGNVNATYSRSSVSRIRGDSRKMDSDSEELDEGGAALSARKGDG
jgi:hypothetical protein